MMQKAPVFLSRRCPSKMQTSGAPPTPHRKIRSETAKQTFNGLIRDERDLNRARVS